jgi:hypothetical protein
VTLLVSLERFKRVLLASLAAGSFSSSNTHLNEAYSVTGLLLRLFTVCRLLVLLQLLLLLLVFLL